MTTPRTDLPQGTLDLLVLQVAATGPIHGYGIAQRIKQVSRDVLQVPQGSRSIRRSTGWRGGDCWPRSGSRPTPAATRSSNA
jgi:hypothetical protein